MRFAVRPAICSALLALVAAMVSSVSAAETLTYANLVNRMANLEQLAVLPEPGETCKQWSSYDRASKLDEKSGKYVAWDANGDNDGAIRREGDKWILAEIEGPGCIERIWSATAQAGHVKIYLDGRETPAVDLPFDKYFSGDTAPFAYPMLSYDLTKMGCAGLNLYFPIPYQKSCRIVADKGWGAYYQFTYRTFPKGTKVPTFSAALAKENAAVLKKTNDFFAEQLGTDPAGEREGETSVAKTVLVAAGKTARIAELSGPAAVTAIRVKMKFRDRDEQMAALRKLVLSITWDGEAKSAVWCPLGDFFGTAPGENHYKSLTTGMTADGYYAYWYMPFGKSAVVELINEDATDREASLEVVHAPLGRPFEGMGHFHAKWHRDTFPVSADRWPDWSLLQTEGRGRFCGVLLHVWNPWGGWWGEGDEKFFIDSEKFPSTFGTGSEDYFGYAWCHPGLFQRPFHGQNMTQGNRGHQAVFRWQIADNVPFETKFDGYIEKYYPTEDLGTQYACLPVWYLDPKGTDPYESTPPDQRNDYYTCPERAIAGFTILDGPPPGGVGPQALPVTLDGKRQDHEQLWWTGARPGDKLNLRFDVQKAGQYRLSALMTKADDYGIVQFHLDGKKLGRPIDLYNPTVIPTEPPVTLGVAELTAGKHTLSVEIVGANEKAVQQRCFFGIHRLTLDEAP